MRRSAISPPLAVVRRSSHFCLIMSSSSPVTVVRSLGPVSDLSLDTTFHFVPAPVSNLTILYCGATFHVDRQTLWRSSLYFRPVIEALNAEGKSEIALDSFTTRAGGSPVTVQDIQLVLTWMYYPYWGSTMPLVPDTTWADVQKMTNGDDGELDWYRAPMLSVTSSFYVAKDPAVVEEDALYLLNYWGCTSMLKRCCEQLQEVYDQPSERDPNIPSSALRPIVYLLLRISRGLFSELEDDILRAVARRDPVTEGDMEELRKHLSKESLVVLVRHMYEQRKTVTSGAAQHRAIRKRARIEVDSSDEEPGP